MPDPQSASGRVDWRAWLAAVLPHVDAFLPSYEELAYVLGEPGAPLTLEALRRFAGQVLELGAGAAAIKLGEKGLYLRTARHLAWSHFTPETLAAWQGRELLATCCEAELVGTTGAGDCTIAGFLAGLFEKKSPEEALAFATAVGACSVEQRDATSGVPAAGHVRERQAAGWPRHGVAPELGAWTPTGTPGVFATEE
jgi:sugar/nucleoside kinase (ribokinase family)